jgi:hypothetical protein
MLNNTQNYMISKRFPISFGNPMGWLGAQLSWAIPSLRKPAIAFGELESRLEGLVEK